MEGHVLRGKRTFIGIPVDSDEETEPSKPCVRRFFQAKVHKVLAVRWFTKRLRKHPARRSCLADAPTPDEKVLLGKVLSSRQLMQRTTEMLQEFQREILGVKGFFDELGVAPEDVHPDVSQSLDRKEAIMRLAVKVIHKAKWLSLRTCYNDHMKYQEQELRILKQQHAQLQNQFATVRQDYLHEVAILRDQARVRGELGSEWDDSGDVVYFFDPVKALSPKEAEFMLAAVKEKVMMILEHNPKLGGVDMGQLEKLKEMKESRETEELRAALVQRGHELAQAEKSLAALREENGRNGVAKLSSAHEQMFAELEDKISQLRFEANALRTSSAREIKERQKTEKRLEVKSEECEELREALQRAELDRGSLQLEASQLKSQLEVAREENLDLHERENALQAQLAASFDANDALKKVVTRQRAIKDIAAEVSEASQESSEEGSEDLNLLEDFMDRELPAFTRPGSSAPTSRASRPGNERLEELLHEAHQQLLEAWQQKEQQLHRAEELKLENAQLQRKLDKQSRGMLVMHAEANASGTTELAQFMQNLRQKLGSPRMDSPKSKDDVSMAFPELEKQLEEASQEAEASLKAVLGALQRFKRQEAGDIQSLQQESLSCQQKKQQLERQLMELRMSRLSKFKAKNGQKLQSLVPVCLQMLEDLSAKMQQLASENVALRQGLLSVSSNLGEATSVMKASASAKGDKDLQRFLHTVSSNVEQVPTVFNRLFNEGRKRDQRMEQQAHERRQSMMHSMLVHLSDDRADSKEDPRTTPKDPPRHLRAVRKGDEEDIFRSAGGWSRQRTPADEEDIFRSAGGFSRQRTPADDEACRDQACGTAVRRTSIILHEDDSRRRLVAEEDMGTGSLGLQCMPSPIRPRLSKRPEDRDREVVVKAPDRVNSKLKNRQQLHLNSYEFRGDMEVSKVKALPSPRKLEGLQLPSVPVHTNNSPRSPSDGSSDESSPQMSPLVSRQATEDKVEKVTSRNLPMVSVQEVELLQESEEGISSTSPMRRRPSDPAPRVPVESWQSRMKNVLTARRSSNFAARDLKRLRRPSAS